MVKLQRFRFLKLFQNKLLFGLGLTLIILALLSAIAFFLVKKLRPAVPQTIDIGEVDAPFNRGKADRKALQRLAKRKQPVTWVFAGDSITHGCMHTDYLRNYQEYFAQAMKASPQRAQDIVVNTGVSGATTAELMQYFDAWVMDYRPDVVFICYGMNDCAAQGMTVETYRQNLGEAVRRIRASGAIPVLHTPNTSRRQRNIVPYLEAARKLAEEEAVLFVDHNAFWSAHSREVKTLMSDAIHPNEYGHLLLCRYLLQSLELMPFAKGLLKSGSYRDIPLPPDQAPVPAPLSHDMQKSRLLAPCLSNGKPSVWVYLGGAATAGTQLSANGARAYPEHIQEVVRWEMIDDEYTTRMRYCLNSAHPGDTVSDMLAHYDDWAGRFRPALVSIMPELEADGLVSEDVFERDLAALVRRARADGALVLLQTPLLLREEAGAYLSVMRRLADAQGVLLLDHALLAQQVAEQYPNTGDKWLFSNGLPNAEGELIIARNFCVTLLTVPKKSRILTKDYSCV